MRKVQAFFWHQLLPAEPWEMMVYNKIIRYISLFVEFCFIKSVTYIHDIMKYVLHTCTSDCVELKILVKQNTHVNDVDVILGAFACQF